MTTGGTESNQLVVLLAGERLGPDVRVVGGANAHHGVHRSAWLLGLPEPPRAALPALGPGAPVLVVATAGTNRAPAGPSPSSHLPRQAPATSIISTARSHPS
jgi:L-2,4-diaminobutyrate decarboxylase